MVDGRAVEPGTDLLAAGLADGAMLGGPGPEHGAMLTVTGGPLPPASVLLEGPVLIGSGRAAQLQLDHPSVAPAHVLVEPDAGGWAVCALGPDAQLDGEPLEGPRPLPPGSVLSVGAMDLELVAPVAPVVVDPPRTPIHRAPRPAPARPPEPPPPPTEPSEEPPPRPPGLLTVVLPVAVGLVLAVAVHPTAGLFSAAVPVLAIGSHLDARRRHRRDHRQARRQHEHLVAEHAEARRAADRVAATEARVAFPTVGTALARAASGTGLWPRRGATDGFDVHLGHTDDAHRRPVVVTVRPAGGGVGIAGPRAWAEAVARALVVQATARWGPADLRLDGSDDGPPSFARWLPHRAGGGPILPAFEVADDPGALSDACGAVLAWVPGGAELTDGDGSRPVRPVVADAELAERYARAAARWSDRGDDRSLPEHVDLATLLQDPAADELLSVPLGRTARGVLAVDLVRHGPHALVAGTTGAGKSELLRSWVAALAWRHPPSAVAFVLVDYKGGSAFDACARLPHVAGVVTDLDAGLGERLLVALRAEVRDREVQLREAGASDLADLEAGPPRLVVVVDEFATLAVELPTFLGHLVDIARRGRSLGVHLVLATQRPAGAVNDDIRANTALRIALRTLDAADSQDVIGGPDAARLPADRPGRAWLRLGDEPVLAQLASTSGQALAAGPPLLVRRVGEPWPDDPDGGPTDLELLVDRAARRWKRAPGPPPVWCPPLPDRVVPPDPEPGRPVPIGRVDRPAARDQPDLTWDPRSGHLVVFGGAGRGRTTALVTALLGLADAHPPDRVQLLLVGEGPGLEALARLPHAGSLVHPADRPALRRLLGRLATARRPDLVVVAVDGIDALTADLDDTDALRLLEDLDRAAREGRARGVALAVTARRPARLPPALLATAATVVTLGLDDAADYGLLGLRAPPRPGPPGRGLTRQGHEVQLFAHPSPDEAVVRLVARGAPPADGGVSAAPLPARVTRAGLGTVDGLVTVGLRDRDLTAAHIDLAPGSSFVIAGPPQSGRTTALDLVLDQSAPWPRSVHRRGDGDAFLAAVRAWLDDPGPRVFAVDDAEVLTDPDGHLLALVARQDPSAVVVVAVRADAWRRSYGSWLAELRPAGAGLALRPDPARDGDCWSTPLPPIGPSAPAGRGVLVDGGTAEVVQVAVD